ncbi:hypothetical protein ACVWYN_002332 [Pedobacter sp. UYP24]
MNLTKLVLCILLLGTSVGCKKKVLHEIPPEVVVPVIPPPVVPPVVVASDVVGKITVGYQAWFSAQGDGSPINAWWHWTQDWGQAPSITNIGIKSWPDVRDFTNTYQTAFSNLGNGQPAKLFSSFSTQTIETHFFWMKQYDIDVAALQRFNPNGVEGPVRDAITAKVKAAAETYGRKFYIMYDVSGWSNMQTEIKADWTSRMASYTQSTAYARQNGKPVVCIWGFGFSDDNHPWSAAACLDVINWFKDKGCYVIGGVPTNWRLSPAGQDSRPGYLSVYSAFHMLSPWMVGRIGEAADSDNFYTNINLPDLTYCKANGIDYLPCVLPGDLQERQRSHGDFMWRQFYNMTKLHSQGLYISMFDEYNEGNQIAKTAETQADVPLGSSFLALDEDGVECSADYYLRLTMDGAKMFKGNAPLRENRTTEVIPGKGLGVRPVPFGQVVGLKGHNGNFIGIQNGTDQLFCTNAVVGSSGQFSIVDAGGGKVALMNQGKYVSSEDGTQPVSCNRSSIGSWERFTWIINSDKTISLRGSNGKYLSALNGASAMTCSKTIVSLEEEFTVLVQ